MKPFYYLLIAFAVGALIAWAVKSQQAKNKGNVIDILNGVTRTKSRVCRTVCPDGAVVQYDCEKGSPNCSGHGGTN